MRRKKEDALPCLENERRREEEGKMNETELEGKPKARMREFVYSRGEERDSCST